MSDTHIEIHDLADHIRTVIEKYRREYNYFYETGISDRDQHNLVRRISSAVKGKLEKTDTEYVEYLEDRVQELEAEVEMAKGPQYQTLHGEYEGMRSLVKELMYRLGKEDTSITIPNDQLQTKQQNVDLDVTVSEMTTKVEVHELES